MPMRSGANRTVLSFMGIPWQEIAESLKLDVAIETSGPLQGVLARCLDRSSVGRITDLFPRIPFFCRWFS